jgi:peptidyl-prolyl cis-trans isomerase B (cyclophilin B)
MQIKIQHWLPLLLLVACLVVSGCSKSETASIQSTASASSSAAATNSSPVAQANSTQESKSPKLAGKATVVLKVKGSPIKIEVNGNDAPITAGNFVDLVQQGVYNGLVFHRVVREPQPFVVQGGDPQGKDPNFPVERLGTGGFIEPKTNRERYIPLEIKPKGAKEPIYSQILEKAKPGAQPQLKHTRGAVAMARSAMPDSASSQFYIALGDLPFLDGSYAVFGYVTEGMDVVDKIRQGDRIDSAEVIEGAKNLKK